MDVIVSALADLINQLASALPHWSFLHDFAVDIQTLTPYFQKANVLFPIDDLMIVFGLVIGLEIVLVTLYWIDRVINLVRGAG